MLKPPWEGQMKPFEIIKGLYYVGTIPASSHLIDTGDGLILIDTGYQQSLYLVIDSIYRLGFKPEDVKYVVHSHGHYDHLGGTRAFVEMTGAKTFLGVQDHDYANGKLDLTWANEMDCVYTQTFEPDVDVHDGDKICLGNIEMRCVSTPGHTPGTMSFFFDIKEDGQYLTCGMQGGSGTNTLMNFYIEKYGLSDVCRQDYLDSMRKVRDEKVDVFLGNHVWNNNTKEKGDALMALRSGAMTSADCHVSVEDNPFVDSSEWQQFIDAKIHDVIELIKAPR